MRDTEEKGADLRRVPVEENEAEGAGEEGEHEEDGKVVRLRPVTAQLNRVVDEDSKGNHCRLRSLKTVDTSINVDGIGAKDCDQGHVDVVAIAEKR